MATAPLEWWCEETMGNWLYFTSDDLWLWYAGKLVVLDYVLGLVYGWGDYFFILTVALWVWCFTFYTWIWHCGLCGYYLLVDLSSQYQQQHMHAQLECCTARFLSLGHSIITCCIVLLDVSLV